jgi:hypothetical protein
MKTNRLFLASVFLFVACGNCDPSPNPPIVTDQDMCPLACDKLNELGCEDGMPIDMLEQCVDGGCPAPEECIDGGCFTKCVDFCVITENQGVWLQPKCIASITECSQVELCTQ